MTAPDWQPLIDEAWALCVAARRGEPVPPGVRAACDARRANPGPRTNWAEWAAAVGAVKARGFVAPRGGKQ